MLKHFLSTFRKNLLTPTLFYLICLFVIFITIWLLLWVAVPEIKLNVLNAISAAFGIELPEDMFKNNNVTALLLIFSVIFVAVLLMLINVIFSAVVTERFINPKIDIYTSKRGVLSDVWNKEKNHILIRLLSLHHLDTLNIKIKCVLSVHEKVKKRDGNLEDFIGYFPVKELTPNGILVLRPKMPWTIAIPVDQHIGNSVNPDYMLNLEDENLLSFRKNYSPIFIERSLELMITGNEPKSYSTFVKHIKIIVDRIDDNGYELILHKGSFASLPLEVKNEEDVENYI